MYYVRISRAFRTWRLWGVVWLLPIGGCYSARFWTNVPLETISIAATPTANTSYATVVDLIVLFDKDLALKVASLPAKRYFPISDQLLHDNADFLLRWRWEVVPGQTLSKVPISFTKNSPIAAFIFARYYTRGDHRQKIPPVSHVAVTLEQETLKVFDPTKDKGREPLSKASTQGEI